MSVAKLLKQCSLKNIYLTLQNDNLRIQDPRKQLTPELLAALKEHKSSILALLRGGRTSENGTQATSSAKPQVTSETGVSFPVLPLQSGMLYHSLEDGSGASYTSITYCHLEGELNVALFQQCWQKVVSAHPILLSAFYLSDTEVAHQVFYRDIELPVTLEDWRGSDNSEPEKKLTKRRLEDKAQGFDLTVPPLMRLLLIRLEDNKYHFVWSHHHILLDGWSAAIVMSNVIKLYSDPCQDLTANSTWQSGYQRYMQWFELQDADATKDFWRDALQGIEPCNNWFYETPELLESENGSEKILAQLDLSISEELKQLANSCQCSVHVLLQIAFATVLSRYSDSQDVVYGETFSGRPSDIHDADQLVGMFINTIPVRIALDDSSTISELVKKVQHQNLDLDKHSWMSLSDIVRQTDLDRADELFSCLLVFENYPSVEVALKDTASNSLNISKVGNEGKTNYPLTLVAGMSDVLSVEISFKRKMMSETTVNTFAVQLFNVLKQMVQLGSQARIHDLQLLSDAEQTAILQMGYGDVVPEQLGCHILDFVLPHLNASNQNKAIVYNDEVVTYAQLDALSLQIATSLQKNGVTPGTKIGVYFKPSAHLMVTILGIMRAGACFVPVDNSWPADRSNYVLQDAGLHSVVFDEVFTSDLSDEAHSLSTTYQSLLIESAQFGIADYVMPNLSASDLAYMIYTSGSTGKPKGVLIEQQGFCNLALNQGRLLQVTSESNVIQIAAIGFDAFCSEFAMAFVNGATMCIPSSDIYKAPAELAQVMSANSISHATIPPALLAECDPVDFPSLTHIIVAGESVSLDTVKRWCQQVALFNAYGPSECSIALTMKQCLPDMKRVTMGPAMNNIQLQVLDSQQHLCPIGVVGELHASGICLARGYHNQEQFNRNKFFAMAGDKRWYRTGDLVRMLANGEFEFIGRTDSMVKLRGFRIELDEINSVLKVCTDAVQVVSQIVDKPASMLVSYIVAANAGLNIDYEEIICRLKKSLPYYMVPSKIALLDSLPLNVNLKTDFKALAALCNDSFLSRTRRTALSKVEESLIESVSVILRLPTQEVNLNASFTEHGGDSLSVMRLSGLIEKQHHCKIPLAQLFQASSLLETCELIKQHGAGSVLTAISPREGDKESPVPASYSQQRIWFVGKLQSSSSHYNITGAVKLQGEYKTELVQTAVRKIISEQSALRTILFEQNEVLYQKFLPVEEFSIQTFDLTFSDESSKQQKVREILQQNERHEFSLEQDFPIQVGCILPSPQNSIIYFCIHHSAADGWSMQIIKSLFVSYYQALLAGKSMPCKPPVVDFADFAVWQNQMLMGPRLETLKDFWGTYLRDMQWLQPLPLDAPRESDTSLAGASTLLSLGQEFSDEIVNYARRNDLSVFMYLLSLWKVTLYRLTGNSDVILGTDLAGRMQPEIENTVGFFVNVLPVRTEIKGTDCAEDLHYKIRQSVMGVFEHQMLPFDLIVEKMNPPRNKGIHPLIQSLFVMQNLPDFSGESSDLAAEDIPRTEEVAKFDFAIFVEKKSKGLQFKALYKTELFKEQNVENMLANFKQFIDFALKNPQQPIYQYQMISRNTMQTPTKQFVNSKLAKFKNMSLKTKKPAAVVEIAPLSESMGLPMVVKAVNPNIKPAVWSEQNREEILALLAKHGAVLFRGFELPEATNFEDFVRGIYPELYGDYGDLPKKEGSKKIYKSTPYPEYMKILFHNESSHMDKWPLKQWFFCELPSEVGGATPIVDCREVFSRISPETIEVLREKELLYVRTFAEGLDVSWQHFFKTDSLDEVRRNCSEANTELLELENNKLQTRKRAQAVTKHPVTGENLFFNQVQLHHPYWLAPGLKDALEQMMGDGNLPRNVLFGDSTAIPDDMLAEIAKAYEDSAIRFDWQQGDVLMLDNMLVAHGRDEYKEPRKIAVAMGDMFLRSNLAGQ